MTSSNTETTELSDLDAIETVGDAWVEQLLNDPSERPVVLYFTTSWCGPCRVFGPRLNDYVAAHPETIDVVRVDGDESPVARQRLHITAYPTMTLVVGGQQQWVWSGTLEEPELAQTMTAIATAAREIGDEVGADANATETSTVDGEPRTVRVPAIDDPRVSVEHDGQALASGEEVTLTGADGLRVVLTSDPRRRPACDVTVLRSFAPGTVTSIELQGAELTVDHLNVLREIDRLQDLSVYSGRPIGAEVLDALGELPMLHSLYLQAPHLDLTSVRDALPYVVVNFDWTSPLLTAHLPGPSPSTAAEPELPVVELSALPSGTVLVLADHPADPASAAVCAAVAEANGVAVGRTSIAVDDAETISYDFVGQSELLLFHDRGLIGRRDTCGPHHVAELEDLARRITSGARPSEAPLAADAAARGSARQTRRTVHLQPHDSPKLLVPPAASWFDHVALSSNGGYVEVPAGWELLAQLTDPDDFDAVPSQDVDALELFFNDEPDATIIAALRGWPRLRHLSVFAAGWSEGLHTALGQLDHLRRLVFGAQSPEGRDYDAELRRKLPWTVVNNDWTHPDLV